METIVQRYHEMTLSGRTDSDNSSVIEGYLEALDEDGLWDDLDLTIRNQGQFKGQHHLGRITAMCAEYARRGDDNYVEAIQRALRGFAAAGPNSYNWWHNEIGMPLEAVSVYVLSEKWIDAESAKILQQTIRQPLDRSANRSSTFTGQNLLWRSRAALLKGCLTRDEKLAASAAAEIHAVIKIGDDEGGQIDGCFLQHGPHIYSHGYGRAFTSDCAFLATLLRDTPWQLTQMNLDALAVIALDGQQWMMRGDHLDFHPTGREISRPDATSAKRYHAAAERLALADPDRAKQYTDWKKRFDGEAGLLVGNKYYWRGDYMVHQTEQMYFSVRMLSSRTRQIECINSENILGAGLSAGATCVMGDGDEYYNIFPLWDWTKLPGATIDAHIGRDAMRYTQQGLDTFAGGVSDGKYGAAAFIYKRPLGQELVAKKAYFAFDEGVVCLGADISGGDGAVFTGVQQCWQNGDVKVGSKSINAGRHDLADVKSISHDGLRYEFTAGQNVQLDFGPRTDTWQKINVNRSDAKVSGNAFGLWISHGELSNSAKPACYAYTVLSESASAGKNPLKILRNDADVQAVAHNDTGVTQIVFYRAGELELSGGMLIKTSQPCMLMLVPDGDSLNVSVADPTQRLLQFELAINGQSKTIMLPNGQMAGSTVKQQW